MELKILQHQSLLHTLVLSFEAIQPCELNIISAPYFSVEMVECLVTSVHVVRLCVCVCVLMCVRTFVCACVYLSMRVCVCLCGVCVCLCGVCVSVCVSVWCVDVCVVCRSLWASYHVEYRLMCGGARSS